MNPIQLIGFSRCLRLGIVLVANIAVLAILFLVVFPQYQNAQDDLRGLKGSIMQKRNDINEMKDRVEYMTKNKGRYDTMMERGFIGDQDRLLARRRLQDISMMSDVLDLDYEIGAVEEENSFELDEIGHAKVKSTMSFDITAYSDIEIYSFLDLLRSEFPGYVQVNDIDIEREPKGPLYLVTESLMAGEMPMVTTKIEAEWVTLRSNVDENADDAANNPYGLNAPLSPFGAQQGGTQ